MREFRSAQCQKLGAPMLGFYQTRLDKAGISSYNHQEVIIVAPYRDLEKQREAERKSHEKIYSMTITIKIRKDDDMFRRRLMAECKKLEITPSEYVRLAVREKLGLPPQEPHD